MGMAVVEKQLTYGEMLHIKYPNLTHCGNCDAVYKQSKHWAKGYSDEGTAGQFYPVMKVPKDKCPIYLTPNMEQRV